MGLRVLLRGHFKDIGDLLDQAVAAPDTGLRFTPYLYGERAPIWDALATASFSGLRGTHTPVDMARALLLGVTDNVIEILRQVEAATCPSEIIYASGGLYPLGGVGRVAGRTVGAAGGNRAYPAGQCLRGGNNCDE